MRKFRYILFFIISYMIVLGLTSCKTNKNQKVGEVEFKYAYGLEEDLDSSIYYSDSYFDLKSSLYNNSLATASLGLSMASYGSNLVKDNSDFTLSSKNIMDLYSKLKFKDFYTNEDFKKKPEINSIGVAFAKKKYKGYTLISSAIRGKGYFKEWASNFEIGESGNFQEGFNIAKDKYLQALSDYINEYKIKGKIKLWAVGYSRSGAVLNLAGAKIDDSLKNNEALFPSVTYTKDDLYFYTFEAPTTVININDNDYYDNIHNILSYDDPIIRLPMRLLGFKRYGVNHYLPNYLNDEEYNKHLALIKRNYNSLKQRDYLGEYRLDKFIYDGSNVLNIGGEEEIYNIPQGIFLDNFFDTLVTDGIISRENYYNTVEEGIMDFFSYLFKDGYPISSISNLLIDVIKKAKENNVLDPIYEIIPSVAKPYIDNLIDNLEIEGEYPDSLDMALSLKGFIFVLSNAIKDNMYLLSTLKNISNISGILEAHSSETILASLMLMDKNYTKDPLDFNMNMEYKVLVGKANYNYTICDTSNHILAKYQKKMTNLDNDVICAKFGDYFKIYVPSFKEYKIYTSSDIEVYRFNSDTFMLEKEEANIIKDGSISCVTI